MSRARGVLLASLVSLALSGCSSQATVLAVEDAKASVLAEEKRMVDRIPPKDLTSYRQLEDAYLLSSRGGKYTWPDQSIVTLRSGADPSAVIAEIAEHYRQQPGFTVRAGKRWDGGERVTISTDDGADYLLSPAPDNEIALDSFSACFTLREDQ
jgi:hypothetical protein